MTHLRPSACLPPVMIAASAALSMLLSAAPVPGGETVAASFYVAPDGNDANPGTEEEPFLTVEHARDTIRGLPAAAKLIQTDVVIRGGVYLLKKPLLMEARDGGDQTTSVTYAAFAGEKVVLSGGVPITNWRRGSNDVWTAELPEGVSSFRQLYMDGERLPRTRYPDTGFLQIRSVSPDSTRIEFAEALPRLAPGGRGAELIVVQPWSISRELISGSDETSVTTRTPTGWLLHGSCLPKKGMSAFLENAPSWLQRPGQWFLDEAGGVVMYKGAPGQDPNRQDVVAPVLEQLLIVKGSRERPVENLHFMGIEFAYSAWNMPEIGYGGIQACYYGTKSDATSPTYAATTAIEFSYARGCSVDRCRMLHLGGSALGLGMGSRGNLIRTNEFADIGGNGPMVGHMPVKTPLWSDWADPADAPDGNEISNCHIHHCGQELWGAVGIFDAMSKNTRILHNELSDLPYGGISVGYVWNTEKTSQENCLVAYNHVHDVLLRLYDSGAIYTLGYQPGSVIRGNLLHGVRRSDYAFGSAGNNGIFFDEGSTGFHLEDNIIYDTADSSLRFNRSQKNEQTWKNNSLEMTPEQAGFPHAIAEKAGRSPAAREPLSKKKIRFFF